MELDLANSIYSDLYLKIIAAVGKDLDKIVAKQWKKHMGRG